MITRFDKHGRDVTDSPGLWSDGDFEVMERQIPSSADAFLPEHDTSGRPTFFGRVVGGKWKYIDRGSRYAAVLCVLNHPMYYADQEEGEWR